MSYILDALRRAEAERERGQVPDLRTQPAAAEPAARALSTVPRWLLASALGLGLLLSGAWLARWLATPPASPAAPASAAPAPSAAPSPAPAPSPATVASVAVPAAAPLPELVRLPPPPPRSAALPPAPLPAAPGRPASAPAPAPALGALPDALRRQLPTLTTGGAMYSATPSQRMLIINGQLYQEGATVAPGLVLEQIKLNSAVLVFQGQRFSISY